MCFENINFAFYLQVLVYLDSHCEVNIQWLEPLLARIQENRTFVVTPIIDIINSDTFQYTASPLVRGGFNWGLHFKWDSLPENFLKTREDFAKPIKYNKLYLVLVRNINYLLTRSPTMAGGLFAVDREYFFDIGEYDAGMNIWGGENLELSFRVCLHSLLKMFHNLILLPNRYGCVGEDWR